jgi:uncharacterized protein DUF1236
MSARYILPSAIAMMIALGLSTGQAQTPGGDASPGGPPTAAPEMGGGPDAGRGAAPDMGGPSGGPDAMQERPDQGAPGPEGSPAAQPGKSVEEKGATPQGGESAEQTMPSEGKSMEKQKDAAKTEGTAETQGKAGTTPEGKAGATTEGKAGATAEGGAKVEGKTGKNVRLESQQVGKVRTYFSEHRPSVKSISKTEVSVSIGVAIPGTIALYDLPPDIIVVEGACPIKYFVWGDDVVLVDSCTRHVVEIIVGVA